MINVSFEIVIDWRRWSFLVDCHFSCPLGDSRFGLSHSIDNSSCPNYLDSRSHCIKYSTQRLKKTQSTPHSRVLEEEEKKRKQFRDLQLLMDLIKSLASTPYTRKETKMICLD